MTSTVPEWLQWLAGGLGLVLVAIFGKLGWGSAKATSPPPTQDVVGIGTTTLKDVVTALDKVSTSVNRLAEQLEKNAEETNRFREELRVQREVFNARNGKN